MTRTLLVVAALSSLLAACSAPEGNTSATEPETQAASADEAGLPADATGFITANPLPLKAEGEIRRDDYGRPYEYALLGEKLPHFTGTMADGTPFDSDSLDNWTIIDVWGIWCGDCRRDAPYMVALNSAVRQDLDLDFLSIHTPASAARATPEDMFGKYGSIDAYFAELGESYPVLVDTDASIRNALKITWTPSYLLVSPEGVVKGYRSEFAAASGEPIKDFMKDIARVKAESRKADAGRLTIGPDGVPGLPAGLPFALEAVQLAFPDREVITARLDDAGESLPVFEVREDDATLLTLVPDWTLGRVNEVRTNSGQVSGPLGEHIGSFRLEDLTDAACVAEPSESDSRVICSDPAHPGFKRVFKPDSPGAETGVLTEMSYTFEEHPRTE